jgi:hypothetical protein
VRGTIVLEIIKDEPENDITGISQHWAAGRNDQYKKLMVFSLVVILIFSVTVSMAAKEKDGVRDESIIQKYSSICQITAKLP